MKDRYDGRPGYNLEMSSTADFPDVSIVIGEPLEGKRRMVITLSDQSSVSPARRMCNDCNAKRNYSEGRMSCSGIDNNGVAMYTEGFEGQWGNTNTLKQLSHAKCLVSPAIVRELFGL